MEHDGKFRVKSMAEANKYLKPVKNRAVEEEISISAVDRLNRLEKKYAKLEAKWKQDHNLLLGYCDKLGKVIEELRRFITLG